MGGIEPIDLPETPLIIGNNFPVQDETAYAREAESQRVAGQQAGGAGGAVLAAANYTAPQFRGNAGAALAERLIAQHAKHADDAIRHANVAAWLDLGADNIAHTKTTMNQISSAYHDGYAALTERAQAQSWTQQQLRKGKDDLVGEAHERVRLARNQFDDRHRAVVNGIANATSLPEADIPPAPPSMPAGPHTGGNVHTVSSHAPAPLSTDDSENEDDEKFLNGFADRLILGGAWTWADGGKPR
jgi:hypothetical protein